MGDLSLGYQLLPDHESQGGDFALGDIDADGRLDIIFMAVNNPSGANDIRYRVRMGL